RLFPANPKHHCFSRPLRRAKTCSVVYHLSDCSRRRSSSSLIGGSQGSYWDGSGKGVTRANTRPDSSHRSRGSDKLWSLVRSVSSTTTLVIADGLLFADKLLRPRSPGRILPQDEAGRNPPVWASGGPCPGRTPSGASLFQRPEERPSNGPCRSLPHGRLLAV